MVESWRYISIYKLDHHPTPKKSWKPRFFEFFGILRFFSSKGSDGKYHCKCQDSPNQCLMPTNTEQNAGIDPKYFSIMINRAVFAADNYLLTVGPPRSRQSRQKGYSTVENSWSSRHCRRQGVDNRSNDECQSTILNLEVLRRIDGHWSALIFNEPVSKRKKKCNLTLSKH